MRVIHTFPQFDHGPAKLGAAFSMLVAARPREAYELSWTRSSRHGCSVLRNGFGSCN